MRKLILLMRVSLDGFVEGPNADMSWMAQDETEEWQDLFAVLENVDLFVMGRGMYADYRNHWKNIVATGEASNSNELAYARLADKTQHIVFSTTITDAGWQNTQLNSGSIVKEMAKIKAQPGKNIQIVGGAKFAATLIDAGLVDEYRISIHPVLLSAGKSFFHQLTVQQPLELIETKPLKSGVVILVLKPKQLNDN